MSHYSHTMYEAPVAYMHEAQKLKSVHSFRTYDIIVFMEHN